MANDIHLVSYIQFKRQHLVEGVLLVALLFQQQMVCSVVKTINREEIAITTKH